MRLSFDDEESLKEAAESLRFNKPPSDPNTPALRRVGSSMSPQEGIELEDIGLNNSPNDQNSLRRTLNQASTSSTPAHWQERSEDIELEIMV